MICLLIEQISHVCAWQSIMNPTHEESALNDAKSVSEQV